MRNVTITLDEETGRWLRLQAAERDTSASRFVGELLRERMLDDRAYEEAMTAYLDRKPRKLRSGSRLPRREEVFSGGGADRVCHR